MNDSTDPTNIPAPSFTADAQVAIEHLKRVAAAGQTLPLATGGPIPPPLTVADLSAKHIGKKIRVADRGDAHTGRIADIEFIVERYMHGDSAEAVRIVFGERATITYPLRAKVEVLS